MNYKFYLKQYRDLLYPILVVIILFICVKFFFQPKISNIFTWRDEIQSQEREIQELQDYIAYLKDLASSTLDVEEGVVNYALPEDKGVVSMIVTFEGLSNTENVRIEPFSIKAGVISENLTNQPANARSKFAPGEARTIDFEMKGSADSIEDAKSFVNEILATRRIIEINDLSWTFKDGSVDMIYSLLAYYLPDPKSRSNVKHQSKDSRMLELVSKLSKSKTYESEVLQEVEVGKENLFSVSDEIRPPTPTPTVEITEGIVEEATGGAILQ